MLDSMSGLPPLKAAITLAPFTWSFAVSSLMIFVKAVTWEVSRPIRPIRMGSLAVTGERAKRLQKMVVNFVIVDHLMVILMRSRS